MRARCGQIAHLHQPGMLQESPCLEYAQGERVGTSPIERTPCEGGA